MTAATAPGAAPHPPPPIPVSVTITARKILIVDDEPAISETLADALRSAGRHDLVVLDVGLPDISGFDVCRALRRHSDVPVLFLTARSDEVDRIVGLELGGDDYVAKPFSPREVVSRIRAILRRLHPEPRVAAAPPSGRFSVDPDGLRIAYHGTWLNLTRYEYLLLEHTGRILSRNQIMESVWQDGGEGLERTVDTHIKTLRGKAVRTTFGDTTAPCPLDQVNRQFTAERPNQLWVSDFTYVSTGAGFVYVAFIIDVFARRI